MSLNCPAFYIFASEASYVYILSRQKFIINAKNGLFFRVFEKPDACGQIDNSVTRQVNFKKIKIGGNAEIQRFKCDILGDFQTMCCLVLLASMASIISVTPCINDSP